MKGSISNNIQRDFSTSINFRTQFEAKEYDFVIKSNSSSVNVPLGSLAVHPAEVHGLHIASIERSYWKLKISQKKMIFCWGQIRKIKNQVQLVLRAEKLINAFSRSFRGFGFRWQTFSHWRRQTLIIINQFNQSETLKNNLKKKFNFRNQRIRNLNVVYLSCRELSKF